MPLFGRSTVTWMAVIFALGAAVAVLIVSRTSSSDSDLSRQGDPVLIAEGADVYGDHCQICHGAYGQGGTGPDLANGLIERYPNVADQRQIILDGPRSMPSFEPRLTDHEIDAVIEFTRFGL